MFLQLLALIYPKGILQFGDCLTSLLVSMGRLLVRFELLNRLPDIIPLLVPSTSPRFCYVDVRQRWKGTFWFYVGLYHLQLVIQSLIIAVWNASDPWLKHSVTHFTQIKITIVSSRPQFIIIIMSLWSHDWMIQAMDFGPSGFWLLRYLIIFIWIVLAQRDLDHWSLIFKGS